MTNIEPPGSTTIEQNYLKKVVFRLGPFLALLYTFCLIDRGNVSNAKLVMLDDLHFDNEIYGLGAGIFFIGYFLFEVPSNLFMEKVGARWWIARIMVSWGIISAAMMFVKTPMHFYTLRFLLGVAEAGFFPGVILYFTYWIPASSRARAISAFLAFTAFAGLIGGPLASVLLSMHGLGGLKGWQWLFLLEGLPSVLLGLFVLFVLPDKPAEARWLDESEKEWIAAQLKAEHANEQTVQHLSILAGIDRRRAIQLATIFAVTFAAVVGLQFLLVNLQGGDGGAYLMGAPWMRLLVNPAGGGLAAMLFAQVDGRIRMMCMVFIVSSIAGNAVGFFQPALVQAKSGVGPAMWSASFVSLVMVIPDLVGAMAMVAASGHSDRSGQRRQHILLGYTVAAMGYVFCVFAPGAWSALAALSLFKLGERTGAGSYWALTTNLLGSKAAAGGIAMINSIGNLGGFIGPVIMGKMMDKTHNNYSIGLYGAATLMVVSGVLGILMRGHPTHSSEPANGKSR